MVSAAFDRAYVSWAKRSLNRIVDADLVSDGSKNAHYRDAIETFQEWYGLTITRDIGRPEQDKIIYLNSIEPIYLEWVQDVLKQMAEPTLPVTRTLDKRTKDVIRSFQSYEGLRADACVGPRTEMRMVKVTGTLPFGHIKGSGPKLKPRPFRPNPKLKPVVLPVDRVVTRLINSSYYHALYNRDSYSAKDRKQRLCVLGKLKRRHGINDKYPSSGRLGNSHHGNKRVTGAADYFRSARSFLVKSVERWPLGERSNAAKGRWLISDLIKDIESGLGKVRRHEMGMYKSSEPAHLKTWLPEVYKMVSDGKGDSKSILSCFK